MSEDIDDDAAVAAYRAQPDEPIPVCPECHTEMEPAIIGEPGGFSGAFGERTMVTPAGWICENRDCPSAVSDLAPAAHPDEGARLNQAVEGEDGGR